MVGILAQFAFALIHASIEVDRHADGDDRTQGAALIRHLGKRCRQALAREIKRGAVEIFLARQFEADGVDMRLGRTV